MKNKKQRALVKIEHALADSKEFSKSEINKFVFQFDDCFDELLGLASFLSSPERYNDKEARKLLISFLVHVPAHLNTASAILLRFERGGKSLSER
jgi:hypothetical protein